MIEPDPRFLSLPVALDGPYRAEVLDQLRHLGGQWQSLNEDLDLGPNAGIVWATLGEPAPPSAPASEPSASVPTTESAPAAESSATPSASKPASIPHYFPITRGIIVVAK